MYMYCCAKCRSFRVYEDENGNHTCPSCGDLLTFLDVTKEKWEGLSRDEKRNVVQSAIAKKKSNNQGKEVERAGVDSVNNSNPQTQSVRPKRSFFDMDSMSSPDYKQREQTTVSESPETMRGDDYENNESAMHMIIKCKMCGGDLQISEGSSIATCEYCGTAQTVPMIDINSSKKINLFERANSLRIDCEFDKAEPIYESIIAEFPKEAEAYWGILLCKYGIEYVDDPRTGKKIPTCHRVSFDRVQNDFYYMKALEYADSKSSTIYRSEGNEIEQIRRKVIEVSNREDPYDVFICYKEKDENGQRTEDSLLAEKIYEELTSRNYRVFFSRISLEDKIGEEYEPYIFAALNSARIMLVIGTNSRHFDSTWVRNEWSRYLDLIKTNKDKLLIPCYKNMDPYDLPKEFSGLQAQDIGKIGAVEDIVRGISKVIPRGTQKVGITEDVLQAVLKKESKKRTRRTIIVLAVIGMAVAIFGYLGINALITLIKNNKQTTVVEKEAVVEKEDAVKPTPEPVDIQERKELELNPNLNKTFIATDQPQNIDGAYDIYLTQNCPLTVANDAGDEQFQKEYIVEKIEYTTVPKLNDTYDEIIGYNLYIFFYIKQGKMGSMVDPDTTLYGGDLYFYDENGNIAHRQTITFKKANNGKKIFEIHSGILRPGKYRIELVDCY